MDKETIGLACDHAGFELMQYVRTYLADRGIPVRDFGTHSAESVDYPDFGHALGRAIDSGELSRGIAICGSGLGISIVLNKYQGVRAALCWTSEIARLAREHNDANVLVLPGRFMNTDVAAAAIDEFLTSTFAGGRHARRVAKIPIAE
ncbi:MAG: ribose 5-phosphate isomerase B [Prevotella sp.]|nr:ribose 5-phosphate isomerase B [Prevotella sp.]